MIDPAIFIGEPLLFQKEIYVYPPKVRDVVANPNFNIYYKVLTLTQDDVREEIGDRLPVGEDCPTPFEYLLVHYQYTQGFAQIIKDAFQFFCKSDIQVDLQEMRLILILGEGKIAVLTKENFFDFQNAVRSSLGDKEVTPPEPIDPDEDPRIRAIKEKARMRDRIKAKQKGGNGISLSTCLVAICCMGVGISPLTIGEMSYASVGEIMKMMQDKEKYDIDIRSLLAGADSKKVKPKYWIRNSDK